MWRVDPENGRAALLVEFGKAITKKKPEGVCRLSAGDGGDLLVVLDGEGGGGAEVLILAD